MPYSLDLLRTFLAVHRAGSVTRASDLLGISQPAVTAQVKTLETAVGKPLFERGPRGMLPTKAADELAARVAAPLDALADVGTVPESRTVHLGGPAEILGTKVLPALAPLVADGLRLRVSFGMPDELATAVASGALDLAICSLRPRSRGLHVTAFYDEEFVLVGAPGHTIDSPLIGYDENLPILRRYWRTVFGTRLNRSPGLTAPDLRAVLAAVVAGAGVTVLPRYLCEAELADGRLHELLTPEVPPLNTLFLVSRLGATHAARETVAAAISDTARNWA